MRNRAALERILGGLFILSISIRPALADTYRILTLNLHGYHPTDESLRYTQDRQGNIDISPSDIYFFTHDELERGHTRRLDRLAQDINTLAPDIAFFQEVGAGDPKSAKDCKEFMDANGLDRDSFGANSVLRLNRRLEKLKRSYTTLLSCRGNIGWTTDADTFKDTRILRMNASGQHEIVYDFGANPYPKGMIVEGLALFVGPRLRVIEANSWKLAIPGTPDIFHVQVAALAPTQGQGWLVVANIHGAHKLRTFEQTLAFRQAFMGYLDDAKRRLGPNFLGSIVGGDLNTRLYRPGFPTDEGEVGGIGWELSVPRYFSAADLLSRNKLEDMLVAYNDDPTFKAWATIRNPAEVRRRAHAATQELQKLLNNGAKPFFDALWTGRAANTCPTLRDALPSSFAPACARAKLIDHIFVDDPAHVGASAVIYSGNDWERLDSLTDHPGFVTTLNF